MFRWPIGFLLLTCVQFSCRTPSSLLKATQDESLKEYEQILEAIEFLERFPNVSVVINEEDADIPSHPECRERMKRIESFMASLYSDSAEPKDNASLHQFFSKQLTPNRRHEMLAATSTDFGETVQVRTYIALVLLALAGYEDSDLHQLIDDVGLRRSFDRIKSAQKGEVRYDGVGGLYHYSNMDLQSSVAYFSQAMLLNPELVRRYLSQSSSDRDVLTKGTNAFDESSRLEPRDLIISQLKRNVLTYSGKETSNNIQPAGYFAERIFGTFIGEKFDSTRPPYLVLRDSIFDSEPVLLCASESGIEVSTFIRGAEDSRMVKQVGLIQKIGLSADIYDPTRTYEHRRKSYLQCAGQKFELSFAGLPLPKINEPILNYRGDIHAVSSVALVSEMSPAMLLGGLGYLASHGYLPVEISTTERLKEDFLKIAQDPALDRVILPVGHSFDVDRTMLGSTKGIKIKALRRFGQRSLYLHIFLPALKSKDGTEFIDRIDMREILCPKDCSGLTGTPSHVTVMTTSCHSAGTIDSWMSAYYLQLEKIPQTPTPLIFASNEGFDTSNPFVIVSHLDHILRFVNGIASGQSVNEIQKTLAAPLEMTTARRILSQASRFIQSIQGTTSEMQEVYSPVCNAAKSVYFEGRYKVFDVQITPLQGK